MQFQISLLRLMGQKAALQAGPPAQAPSLQVIELERLQQLGPAKVFVRMQG